VHAARRTRVAAPLTALVVALGLLVPAPVLAQTPFGAGPDLPRVGTDELARDSWIVRLVEAADAGREAPGLARFAGGAAGLVYRHALNGFQFRGSAAAAAALGRNPRVASVEPDRPVFLTETLPWGVWRVDAYVPDGDGAYQAGFRGAGARIAVLDTGIDLGHPDLVGSIDPALGRNCVDGAQPPNDGYGHGTHVAGIAAAPLNGEGVVGVAPEARLVAVKVFDDAGNSAESIVLCGLDHITALNSDGDATNDIDVANMSWGEQRAWGNCATDALHAAICRASAANVTLVAGAGNSAVDAGTFVPAAFPEVISVSALADFDGHPGGAAGCGFVPDIGWFECDDTMAFFSNWGGSVDAIAPGVGVHSSWAGGGYRTSSGTSMATPHVTGVVAVMAGVDAGLTPAEALDVIRRTGECPGGVWADADGSPGCTGQGSWPDDPDGVPEVLPNALRAARGVGAPPPPPPDPTPPAAPTLNTASGDASSITLSWSAPANDGGSPITGYEVWRGAVQGGSKVLLETLGDQHSYVDSTVSGGTTYWYEVAAINAVGVGPHSNELGARLATPPSAPTLLGASADRSVALSWTVPDDDGGSPITGYEIHRRVGDGPEDLLARTGPDEMSHVDGGLTNGVAYTYRVAALNAGGRGAFSNAVTVTPSASATVPGAPLNLTAAKAKGTSTIVLSWSPPASDGGSPISTYFVYRRAEAEASFRYIGNTPNGTTTQFTDSTAARRTLYTYYVTAWNGYGQGPPSNQVSIRSR
jgi:subtilisin family serine protease